MSNQFCFFKSILLFGSFALAHWHKQWSIACVHFFLLTLPSKQLEVCFSSVALALIYNKTFDEALVSLLILQPFSNAHGLFSGACLQSVQITSYPCSLAERLWSHILLPSFCLLAAIPCAITNVLLLTHQCTLAHHALSSGPWCRWPSHWPHQSRSAKAHVAPFSGQQLTSMRLTTYLQHICNAFLHAMSNVRCFHLEAQAAIICNTGPTEAVWNTTQRIWPPFQKCTYDCPCTLWSQCAPHCLWKFFRVHFIAFNNVPVRTSLLLTTILSAWISKRRLGVLVTYLQSSAFWISSIKKWMSFE